MLKLRALVLGASSLLALVPARTQTVISWANVGTDFATGSNWVGGVAPVGDTAQFSTASPTYQPVLAANLSVNGVVFANGAGSFDLSGAGTLDVGSGGVSDQSTAFTTIALAMSFGTASPSITNSGSLAISGTITNNASPLGMVITNSGSMGISGSVVNNASLGISFSGIGTGTVSGVISGAGPVAVGGSGEWTLSGANTYSGGTTVSSGTLQVDNATGSATGTGAVTISSGATMLIGNDDSSGSVSANITNNGIVSFLRSDALLNYGGNISGTGSVIFAGPGMVTLSGTNTYTGITEIVSGSTLADGASNAFSPASLDMFVDLGGTLDVNFNETLANLSGSSGAGGTVNLASGTTLMLNGTGGASFPGTINGLGGLTIAGTAGTFTETLKGANTYSGGTTISSGTLLADNATGSATGTGSVTVSSGASLQIGNDDGNGSVSGNITNNGTLNFDRSDTLLNYGGIVSGAGSVFISGSGEITLSGASTFTGSTVVFSGNTLADGTPNSFSAASFGMFVSQGAVLDVNFNEAVANLGDSSGAGGTVNLASGATLSLTGATGSLFSGTISGPGSLTVAGTGGSYLETFKGANTYSGGTTITSGTLVLSNGITGSATGTGPVTISSGGTLKVGDGFSTAGNLTGNITDGGTVIFQNPSGTSISYGGSISGSGGVTQAGIGTVTLSGLSSYSGTTSINSGTLIVANGATGSATGSGAVLVNGSVNLQIGNGAAAGTVQGNIADNASMGNGVYFDSTANESYNGAISNTGAVTQEGSGTTTLGGQNTYTGKTFVLAGTLADGAADAFSPVSLMTLGPGTLDVNFNESIPGLSDYGATNGGGAVNLSSGAILTIGNSNSMNPSYSGSISGPGSLAKIGANKETLSGSNTYTGGTTINAGFIDATNASGSATGTGTVTIASGATLQVGAFGGGTTGAVAGNIVDNGTLNFDLTVPTTFGGSISGTGAVLQLGASSLTLTGTNTYSGSTTVTSGATLADSVAGSLSPNSLIAVTSGSQLDVNADETIAGLHVGVTGPGGIVSLVSGVKLIIDSSGYNFAGVISGPGAVEIAAGPYSQGFTGANTYTGGTTIDLGGSLALGDQAQGENGSVVGAILDNGTLVLNQSDDSTLSNPISGSGSLVVNAQGTNTTIPNANTFTGGTTINSGTILVTNTTGSALGTGAVLVTSSTPQSLGSGGSLEGSGFVSGAVTLNGGGVIFPVNLNDTASTAFPATLNVGATTFNGGAAMGVVFNDVSGTPGTNWSLLNVNGPLTLNAVPTAPIIIGLISLNQSNQLGPVFDFNASSAYSWEIMAASGGISGFNPNAFFITTTPGTTGSETKLAFLNSTNSGSFSVSENGDDLFLNFTPVPEPSTWALLASGTALVAAFLYRRRRRAA